MSVFSLRTASRMLGSIADGRCMVMIPSVSVSSSYGMPGSLKRTKARVLPSASASEIWVRLFLGALLADVKQDAVFRHLGHERLLRVRTSVFLGGLPSARRVLQHRVDLAVGGHLGDPLSEAGSQ